MMTIKEFSGICRCSAQTLRYYDKIDLLKPAKVDPWSGYRYYEAEQSLDFVKIKNLQAADFSIEEIKLLLRQSDRQIHHAFDKKIEDLEKKLEQIKSIQQSYLREKTGMELIIRSISDFLIRQLTDFDMLREFGLTPEDGPKIIATVRSYLERSILCDPVTEENLTMVVNDEIIHGADNVAERIRTFSEATLSDTVLLGDRTITEEEDFDAARYDLCWDIHGWKHVYEFIDQIPAPEAGWEYCCWFQMPPETCPNDIAFPLFMLGALLLQSDLTGISISCVVDKSKDLQNHFSLLRQKHPQKCEH